MLIQKFRKNLIHAKNKFVFISLSNAPIQREISMRKMRFNNPKTS